MTDRSEFEAGQTYGFGATARRSGGSVCRRTTGLLSILALALVVALATVITVMPTETSAAVSTIDPLLR